MQLIERFASSEAAASAAAGAANAAYFAASGRSRENRGRRAGAAALVLVNLSLAVESALYLAFLPGVAPGPQAAAAFIGRSLILVAVATISALILRREAALRGRR